MITYAGLQNRHSFDIIKQQLKELEESAGRSFNNTQLICLLQWSNKGSYYEAVKLLAKTLPLSATADQIAEQLEDSIKLVDIAKGKEERRKWESEQL